MEGSEGGGRREREAISAVHRVSRSNVSLSPPLSLSLYESQHRVGVIGSYTIITFTMHIYSGRVWGNSIEMEEVDNATLGLHPVGIERNIRRIFIAE